MSPCPREVYLGSPMEVGTAQKANKMDSQPCVYYDRNFSFFCCLSHSVGDPEWECGKGALLLQVSLRE